MIHICHTFFFLTIFPHLSVSSNHLCSYFLTPTCEGRTCRVCVSVAVLPHKKKILIEEAGCGRVRTVQLYNFCLVKVFCNKSLLKEKTKLKMAIIYYKRNTKVMILSKKKKIISKPLMNKFYSLKFCLVSLLHTNWFELQQTLCVFLSF